MTYPRVPTRSAGTTIACHPFAIASAAAVVGPPIFAFDAIFQVEFENLTKYKGDDHVHTNDDCTEYKE